MVVSRPALLSSREEGPAVATARSQPCCQAMPKVSALLLVDKTPGPESWDHQLANGVGGKPAWTFGGPAQACSACVALGRSSNLSGTQSSLWIIFLRGQSKNVCYVWQNES